ncbi:hypothetical protein [Methyloceanibacter caenitepidi]|uniref:Phage terminase, small subunit n=1 Tax=Methyloceanibacter caenitepidi TaxID=1384459 RepID=A0A0A8K203_9HYPH|nr:hypothetical protein [Methyloceanibacter caenitepidi]BAQ16925.1 hypothetical protein GL4_1469 [Methyloceanibacter caenitepidi]
MGERGRQSKKTQPAEKGGSVPAEAPTIERIERPPPPDVLTDEQAEIWRQVVNRLPADWFKAETLPLLEAYCRHAVQSRRVAALIEQMELAESERIARKSKKKTRKAKSEDAEDDDAPFPFKDYDRLLKMQARESGTLASLSVKLRISQSTTYDKSKAKGGSGKKTPWEG